MMMILNIADERGVHARVIIQSGVQRVNFGEWGGGQGFNVASDDDATRETIPAYQKGNSRYSRITEEKNTAVGG